MPTPQPIVTFLLPAASNAHAMSAIIQAWSLVRVPSRDIIVSISVEIERLLNFTIAADQIGGPSAARHEIAVAVRDQPAFRQYDDFSHDRHRDGFHDQLHWDHRSCNRSNRIPDQPSPLGGSAATIWNLPGCVS